jgi:fluoroacetyl-CoA thioesterase
MSELKFNDCATVEWTVSEADLATTIAPNPADSFLPVFATPRLIGIMELACSRLMRPVLEPGEATAGVAIEMTHGAPTLEGSKVTVKARFVGRDGKLYVFQVTAADPAGEIGRATHKRAVLSADRLLAGARRRLVGA